MKIAIVGTGISGLTAAHVLGRQHQISVFEANPYIGGHTNTIHVTEPESGRSVPVDTGFIVFNDLNYPNLCRLFDELGVESRSSDMSFSVHCRQTGLEYNGSDLDRIFCQRSNLFRPGFWMMLRDILRFHRQGPSALANRISDHITVEEFAAANAYTRQFIDYYLVPLGASLWSCPAKRFRRFPMRFVLEFLDNHCMLQVENRPQWRTVVGGSYRYIEPLTRNFRDRIFTSMPVRRVVRKDGRVNVELGNGNTESFDEVIMASHADQSLRLVEDIEDEERAILEHFPYQDNEANLHTDTSLLPRKRKAWASWNYRIPMDTASHASLTYNMNMLQGIESHRTYCVSLNQADDIAPGQVIRRIRYHHPVFVPGRDEVQANQGRMIQRRGISYCGAYWGFGFHEDGVRSALAVVSAFDQELAA